MMTVLWTDFAKLMLREIHSYYSEHAGRRVADGIVEGILSETEKLALNQSIGQHEELLAERPQEFRYLVQGNYKIIYWVNSAQTRVEVVDVFDTRQNPVKMSRGK